MPTPTNQLSADDPNRAGGLAGDDRLGEFRALLRKAGMTEADIETALEIARGGENDDRVIWGATSIAREADFFKANGKPDERRAYYLLEIGVLAGRKVGKQWTSTPRLLRASLVGGAVEQAAERAAAIAASRRAAKEAKQAPPTRRRRTA